MRLWACHGPTTGTACPSRTPTSGTPGAVLNTPAGGCASVNGSVTLGFVPPDPAVGAERLAALRRAHGRHADAAAALPDRHRAGLSRADVVGALEREDAGATARGRPRDGRDRPVRRAAARVRDRARLRLSRGRRVVPLRHAHGPRHHAAGRDLGAIPRRRRGRSMSTSARRTPESGSPPRPRVLDGQPVATRAFDPVPLRRPVAVRRRLRREPVARLRAQTRARRCESTRRGFADGAHQLEISVNDAAGNVRSSRAPARDRQRADGHAVPPRPRRVPTRAADLHTDAARRRPSASS